MQGLRLAACCDLRQQAPERTELSTDRWHIITDLSDDRTLHQLFDPLRFPGGAHLVDPFAEADDEEQGNGPAPGGGGLPAALNPIGTPSKGGKQAPIVLSGDTPSPAKRKAVNTMPYPAKQSPLKQRSASWEDFRRACSPERFQPDGAPAPVGGASGSGVAVAQRAVIQAAAGP